MAISGDVSVAGLLTGQDIVKIKDSVEGDFVVIPSHIIKSDEPILIDGMSFDDLKKQFDVPVIPQDLDGFLGMISSGIAEEGEYFYIWQNNPRNQAAVAHPATG